MRFIKINNNKVVGVRFGSEIVDGEIQSDIGDIDQILLDDGTFIDPSVEPIEPQPTLEEMQTQILLNTEYLVVMSELTNI